MQSTVPIYTAVDGCAHSFLSLADQMRKPTRFAEQVTVEAILDEFDRFKLWAGNIAAHGKGRRSLDNRLRDAANVRAETHGLLTALTSALRNATAIVVGERITWDEETYSDSESEHSDDETSNLDLQGDTELKQLYASMKAAVTSLMRISMAIREPALTSESRSIDMSHFEQHDVLHVQTKFAHAPQYLAERLGRAISSRRQSLTYRESHHDKLVKGIDKLGLEAARTELTTNSTEASELQQTYDLNMVDDLDDSTSQTSYATSVNATVRAPRLPREAREKEHYKCPICFVMVAIHTAGAWKRHVYQDLHPYCCTFQDCTTADRLYDSRHTWFAHELEAHHSSFQCVEGCSKRFQTEPDFEDHVKSSHSDLAAPAIYSALKRPSTKTSGLIEQTKCSLCGQRMTLRAMQKHLGHHQEQLALFALPANVVDTDEEEREFDELSPFESLNARGEEEEGQLTDLSDVSESEEMTSGLMDPSADGYNEFLDDEGVERPHEIPHGTEMRLFSGPHFPPLISDAVLLSASIQTKENERDVVARVAARDAYNDKREARNAAEESNRFIDEFKREYAFNEIDAENIQKELLVQVSLRRKKLEDDQLAEEEELNRLRNLYEKKKLEEYETLMREQVVKAAEELSQRVREIKDLKKTIRERPAQSRFTEDRVKVRVTPDESDYKGKGKAAGLTPHDPPQTSLQPTYLRISRDHLELDTLHYYDIPYELEVHDPKYIIILREMNKKETEVLFEHTRRLRSSLRLAVDERSLPARSRHRSRDRAFIGKKWNA